MPARRHRDPAPGRARRCGQLEDALEAAGIPYRAETSSLVYGTREVRDLLVVAPRRRRPHRRARAGRPRCARRCFGCGDDDLYTFQVDHHGRWNHQAPLPETLPDRPPGRRRRCVARRRGTTRAVARAERAARPHRARAARARGRVRAPAAPRPLAPRPVRRRPGPRVLREEAERRRRCATSCAGPSCQAAEGARVVETVLPETDDDAVRILTIHGAKGLEFPITIVSGHDHRACIRRSGRAAAASRTTPTTYGPAARRSTSPPTSSTRYHADRRADGLPREAPAALRGRAPGRATTSSSRAPHRAQRPRRPTAVDPRRAAVGGGARTRRTGPGSTRPLADPLPAPSPPLAPVPSSAPGPSGSRHAITRSPTGSRRACGRPPRSRPRRPSAPARARPGLAKDARDLELPPWNKGRYGTAIGRAVHAVLQTVDLRHRRRHRRRPPPRRPRPRACSAGRTTSPRWPASRSRPNTVREAVAPSQLLARDVRRAPRSEAAHARGLRRPRLPHAPTGLVVVDYKTDAWRDEADLDAKVARYRLQGASYALALEGGDRASRWPAACSCSSAPAAPTNALVGDLARRRSRRYEHFSRRPPDPDEHEHATDRSGDDHQR